MQVAVSGASGLIGSALSDSLRSDGHTVLPMVRRPLEPGEAAISWDPDSAQLSPGDVSGLDAVVHLAGENIGARRWSRSQKQRLLESRRRGTTAVAEAIRDAPEPPPVLISASGITYYGDRGDDLLDESSPAGDLFLSEICQVWEAATAPAAEAGTRVAMIRSGVVMDRSGGAMKRMMPILRSGLGGPLGNGRQWWPWITLADEVAAIRFLLDHDVEGPVNLCSPEPATNAEITRALARALGRPARIPVPKFGPRLLLGTQLANELLFASQRVLPKVLTDAGFEFSHPDITTAAPAVVGR